MEIGGLISLVLPKACEFFGSASMRLKTEPFGAVRQVDDGSGVLIQPYTNPENRIHFGGDGLETHNHEG